MYYIINGNQVLYISLFGSQMKMKQQLHHKNNYIKNELNFFTVLGLRPTQFIVLFSIFYV
jgi:hypothetical protein